MVARLSAAEIPGALRAAHDFEGQKRDLLVDALLGRWAELDPAAAAKCAFGLNTSKRDNGGTTPLTIWAEKELDAASAWLLAQQPGHRRDFAILEIASRLVRKDPAAATRFLEHLENKYRARFPSTPNGFTAMSAVLQWAKKDFDAAAHYARGVKNRELRQALLGALGSSESRSPQEVLTWADAIDDQDVRSDITTGAIARLADGDPHAALTYLRTLPSGLQFKHADGVIRKLAERDIAAARRAVEELPEGRTRSGALTAMLSTWIRTDLDGATSYVKTLPEGSARTSAIRELASRIPERDRMAALELASLLPAGHERERAMHSIASQWAGSEPKAAAEYLLQNPPGERSYSYNSPLQAVIQKWASTNARELLEWARALPDEKERNAILSTAIPGVARIDPLTAAKELAQVSSHAQANVAAQLAATWAGRDPAAAANWAASLPEGEVRGQAFSAVAKLWANLELSGPTKWLESLAPGKSRDAAVHSFASRVAEKDPESALAWAGTIEDARARTGAVEKFTRSWLRRDETAATAWIQATPLLDDRTRARLLADK